MRLDLLVIATMLVAANADARADDWPQWRGPNRDGTSAESGLLKEWPQGGPKLLWTADGLGTGWSSPAIARSIVYVTGVVDKEEVLFAYDLDGNRLWRQQYGPAWTKNHQGTRYTPTVAGDMLHVMTGSGQVSCFEAATGAKEWTVGLVERFKARPPRWGFAEGLLVDGDKLFCTPGAPDAALAALNRATGQTVWTTKGFSDDAAYCAPILVGIGDTHVVVTITGRHVVGVSAASGEVLWRKAFRNLYGDHAVTPVYHNGRIYAAAGEGCGGVMLKLAPDLRSVATEWTDPRLDPMTAGVVLADGYIYGTGDRNPNWVCLDWLTGKVMWEEPGIGRASLAYADGMLYGYSQLGLVGLVRPDPQGFRLVSAFPVPKGTGEHWAHPVISGGRLFIRHGGAMMVYDVRVPEKAAPAAPEKPASPTPGKAPKK